MTIDVVREFLLWCLILNTGLLLLWLLILTLAHGSNIEYTGNSVKCPGKNFTQPIIRACCFLKSVYSCLTLLRIWR
jgi:hypothetical protein